MTHRTAPGSDQRDLIERAVQHYRDGRLREAAKLCEQIVRSQPGHVDALLLLGVTALASGDGAGAVEFFERGLAVDPRHPDLLNNLGLALKSQNKLERAAIFLRKAVEVSPESFQLQNNLGSLLMDLGQIPQSMESFRRAIALGPDYATAHYNLGNALCRAGDPGQAVRSYRRALELNPNFAEVWVQLGELLNGSKRLDEAETVFREALSLHPDNPALHCGLGDTLHLAGKLKSAIACYRTALRFDSALVRAWDAMGCAQLARKDHAEAMTSLRRCVDLHPAHAEAHHSLAEALFNLGQTDPALEHFRRSLSLNESEGRNASLQSIAVIIPGSPTAGNEAILEARREWGEMCTPRPRKNVMPPAPISSTARRLRLGYVSAFLHRPNWMKPVWGLVNAHDRDRFEIHLFSDSARGEIEHGYREHPADRFHDIGGLSNEEAARLIEENQIEVLVDLNGYSRARRLLLFAQRPAPVIAGWFNMYATTGLACFDYLIGDEHVLPVEEERYYSEKILRVPGSYLTFELGYPVPEVAPSPGLTAERFTFGCLSSQYKITTEVIEAWSTILRRAPGARLVIKNAALGKRGNRGFVSSLFTSFGIAAERIELEGPAAHYDFLLKYNEIDVALDTFPYNGGTTTTEAIWQGVPVVSFWGDRWVSRTSASILRTANLKEFVADDVNAYISRAVELARGDRLELNRLRTTMRTRLRQSPICDTRAFAASMEDLYREMKERKVGHENKPGTSF